MAREAEAGLDVTKLRRRPGRPAMGSGPADTLPVRLDPELRRAVEERAAADDTTRPTSCAQRCVATSRRADPAEDLASPPDQRGDADLARR